MASTTTIRAIGTITTITATTTITTTNATTTPDALDRLLTSLSPADPVGACLPVFGAKLVSAGVRLVPAFSRHLADLTIDVSAGDKMPRKGGPGITRSDPPVINRIDLVPRVGADPSVMDRDARRMRGARPFIVTNLKDNRGVAGIADFVPRQGGITA